ncbi:MAG: flagellar hook-basal body complex protein FliE [Rhodoblastus sp.]|nr:MAG: flagellar hook-basal body complex protein FliE [Rhodoblastus sp.]
MTFPALSALSALSSAASAAFTTQAPAADAAPAQGSFSEFLTRQAKDAAHALGEAETAALDGVAGRASLTEVATKVMAAERTLQTAIALRDRFVSSLQEISRIQI